MAKRLLHTYVSLTELSFAAAEQIIQQANQSISSRGVFRIALAGGSTPRVLYEIISSDKYIDKTDWSLWIIYFGDERIVSLADERSNYATAKRSLLDKVPLKEGNIYIPSVDLIDSKAVATDYETRIRDSFTEEGPTTPQLDLILLGLGSDGHTASLFPGKASLKEVRYLVVDSTPGILPPPVNRITFTLPFINASRRVMFLASGEDKLNAFRSAYYGKPIDSSGHLAVAYSVQPTNGDLDWFVTKELSSDE